ncbi:hypothetical protein HK100_006983, partial [Physocladia obscura]
LKFAADEKKKVVSKNNGHLVQLILEFMLHNIDTQSLLKSGYPTNNNKYVA